MNEKKGQQTTKCPMCDECVPNAVPERVFFREFNQKEYKLFYCQDCDLGYWMPLEMVPEFYSQAAMTVYQWMHEGIELKIHSYQRPFLGRRTLQRGKLLDVGCGSGAFLKKAKDLGFEVWGVDLDPQNIDCAKKKLGLENVYCMTLDEFADFAESKGLTFDVVTFFEVLEHNPQPRMFMASIRRMLKNGGLIAGSVPNRKRFWVELDRKGSGDHPPHHFLWISWKTMRAFLEQEKFHDIYLYRAGFNIGEICSWLWDRILGGATQKIKNVFIQDRAEAKRPLKWAKDARLQNVLFFPLAFLIKPFFNKKGYQIYFEAQYSGDDCKKRSDFV